MNRGKILFIHHLPFIGGATQSLLGLSKLFVNNNYDVTVLFFESKGGAYKLFEKSGIKCYAFPRGKVFQHAYGAYIPFSGKKFYRPFIAFYRSVFSILPTKRMLKKLDPDIVYLNTSLLFPAAIAAKMLKKKIVWHLREQIHDGNWGFRKQFIRFLFKRLPDEIIAISKTNASVLNIPKAKIVYNSVDLKVFSDSVDVKAFKARFDVPNARIISFLGGKILSKGAPIFIQTAAQITRKYPDLIFIIAGEIRVDNPNSRNKVEREVYFILKKNPKLIKNLIFTGIIENVAPLLALSTIVTWPATVPHFARPIMEAMVMGKPVVACNFSSTSEILTHNQDGLLVAPKAEEFEKGICYLLENKKKALKMGEYGRVKAIKLFDNNKNDAKILKIVDGL
jgi:glycosyltransferase involved in cell wall biosynthesis